MTSTDPVTYATVAITAAISTASYISSLGHANRRTTATRFAGWVYIIITEAGTFVVTITISTCSFFFT